MTRISVVALALAGFAVAVYLTFDEIGVVSAWEPLFGGGTQAVLHSAFSRSLPVPDAALGAIAYLGEAITAAIALRDIEHGRLPPVVVIYVVTGVGLGVAAILLVLVQAFVVRAWCTLCLVSSAISLALAVPAASEGIARARGARRTARPRPGSRPP